MNHPDFEDNVYEEDETYSYQHWRPIDEDEEAAFYERAMSQKLPLTHRTGAKVAAFILCIAMAFLAFGCVIGAWFMIEEDLYTTPEKEFRYETLNNIAETDVLNVVSCLLENDEEGAVDQIQFKNIAGIYIESDEAVLSNWYWGIPTERTLVFQRYCSYEEDGRIGVSYRPEEGYSLLTVNVYLLNPFSVQDDYYMADLLVSAAYALRYWVYVIGVLAVVLSIASFVFLMCAAGRKPGHIRVVRGWSGKIALDALTLAIGVGSIALLLLADDALYFASEWETAAVLLAVALLISIAFLGWCMTVAVQVKLGRWWENSVIYFLLKYGWRFLKKLGKGLLTLCRAVGRLIASIPLVWKTVCIFVGISAIELLVIALAWWEMDNLFIFWILEKLILFPAVMYIALNLRKLKKSGEAMAAGDLSCQVDTKHMFWDLKRHGENLNSIGEGITLAVEQRTKSERMKTELITNVSHDIKTPLTSIINYSDLISREPTENEKITEYAEVLHRQSERLKRLIEDLVEASKASTGNLEVNLAPCELGVMLTQTVGEYQQKLKGLDLNLITTAPETPVKIMADGRRLWRVFDNLMNNICKYALSGTRVYLTLEEKDGRAVISFKNTSRDPLNIPADELMERFIQGDAARKTEGNGLGLSIAKSLTELQNGTLDLTVDGDLFKAVLTFPII
ncbi:MAG: HAMP domain-containing histidine kinase [Ruminococcaceae bacterium]|nr:HAMP domain-containing histidine kinase [Oscillospiraceae bacterium]